MSMFISRYLPMTTTAMKKAETPEPRTAVIGSITSTHSPVSITKTLIIAGPQ